MMGIHYPDSFKLLVAALEPWLDQVVITGAWAHRLCGLHHRFQELDYSTLTTWIAVFRPRVSRTTLDSTEIELLSGHCCRCTVALLIEHVVMSLQTARGRSIPLCGRYNKITAETKR